MFFSYLVFWFVQWRLNSGKCPSPRPYDATQFLHPVSFWLTALAAFSTRFATAIGCDTYIAWLPDTSTTFEPARLDMKRCAGGGIILSSVAIKYQLGLVLHAASLIIPLSAPTPHGTWESAMNAVFSAFTSAANEGWNFALSRN